jgi:DNA-binding response OmpR family regulator
VGSDVPVVMLTALGADQDKLEAFEAGADDYLVKPFSARELVARVGALLRRTRLAVTSEKARPAPLQAGPFTINPDAQTVQLEQDEIDLTPIEYALLQTLVRAPGRIFTESELLTRVWGQEYRDQAEILRTTMHRLRQKLEEDPTQPRYLCTRTGVGYYFSTD